MQRWFPVCLLLFASAAWATPRSVAALARTPDEGIAAQIETALGEDVLAIDDAPSWPPDLRDARAAGALRAVAASPKACALRRLVLLLPVPSPALAELDSPCLATLEELHVRALVDEDPARVLAAAPFAPALRTLALWRPISAEALAVLLPALPALESLRISIDAATEVATVEVLAAQAPRSLRQLTLTDAPLDREGVRVLVEAAFAARLTHLGVKVADLDAAVELGARAPHVEMLVELGPRGARSAWGSARAAARMVDQIVPFGVQLSTDGDVQRLAGVRAIEGELDVSGAVSDLSPLSQLARVEGRLRIRGTSLTTLDGLAALERVGGELRIESNRSLTSTAGLRALREVGSHVQIPWCIVGNPRLARIAFPALERVGGTLSLSTEPGGWNPVADSHVDAPCGRSRVERVTIAPFAKLRSVGRPVEGPAFVDEHPALFPALER